jgi:N-acetylglucosaminyl-diphospho-decaprenol L-rhamnosyltransferase
MTPPITLSVVSHGQNALVNALLEDIERLCAARVTLLLTENVPDAVPLSLAGRTFSAEVIRNAAVTGFAANHNAAFARCQSPYFCVVNPDIRLRSDPFAALLDTLSNAAVAGPKVLNPAGAIEDSARRFPTGLSLFAKFFRPPEGPDYPADRGPLEVDWLAGMFLLFRSNDFRAVGGFDEAYFLYYEDVDLCRRLHRAGRRVVYDPRAEVVHDARRASRKNLRLMRHHAQSAARFLLQR